MSAQEIITAAYRKNGIKSPTTQQSTDGLQDLQNMLSSWSAEGLIVPYYTTENFTLTAGQAIYTIGSGGDLNTVRPLKIINAFIRISNDDHPVGVNMTQAQFNSIVSKDMETRPRRLYYDPQYPLGKIKFNREAEIAYDFHLISEKPLINPSALTTTFSIPQEFNEPLIYNLAVKIAPDNDNKLPPEVFLAAITGKETLERYNAVDKLNEPVTLDNAIIGRRSSWDIYAGE